MDKSSIIILCFKNKKVEQEEFHPRISSTITIEKASSSWEKKKTFLFIFFRSIHRQTMQHIDDTGGAFDDPILMKFVFNFFCVWSRSLVAFGEENFSFLLLLHFTLPRLSLQQL